MTGFEAVEELEAIQEELDRLAHTGWSHLHSARFQALADREGELLRMLYSRLGWGPDRKRAPRSNSASG